ncbi:MAG: relaxase/mobilization nuclease domain-containing protein [Symploca sp. SIO2E9]|nr:relaxase/mobilization nuclease domain-containing protein [Symploca sp. SIO2E9]
MIGKQVFGKNFRGCLDYVLTKAGARLIGSNMIGTTPTSLAAEFNLVANRSQRVEYPVCHISLSPHPDDQLEDNKALAFVRRCLEEIGMKYCQWVLAEHTDTQTPKGKDRPHFHLVANRVQQTDGKTVNSWKSKRDLEKALRQLELEFDLKPVKPSWETARSAPNTGQERRYRREKEEYEATQNYLKACVEDEAKTRDSLSEPPKKMRSQPPELSAKVQLQDAIDACTQDKLTLLQLIEHLQGQGIEAEVIFTRTNKVRGIVYRLGDVRFSGTQLGKTYTFGGLQQYTDVDYEPERDNAAIKALRQQQLETTGLFRKKTKGKEEKEVPLPSPSPTLESNISELNQQSMVLPEKDKQKWKDVRLRLSSEYGLPPELSEVLHEEGLLYANEKGQAVFVKQPIGNQTNSAFWLATQGEIKRAIVTDNPVEALSAMLIDEEQQQTVPTLYLSIEKAEQLPKDLLQNLDQVIVGLQNPELTREVIARLPNAQQADGLKSWNDIWQEEQQKKQLQLEQEEKQQLQLESLLRERWMRSQQLEL